MTASAGSPRRELAGALLSGLAGGILLLIAAREPWASGHATTVPGFGPKRVDTAGHSVLPAVPAVGYLALAGTVAVLATRRAGRVAVGAVLAVAGIAVTVASGVAGVPHRLDGVPLDRTGWPLAAVVGGVLVAAAGSLVVLRGRRWAGMSARYDAPARRPVPPADTEAALWDELDRGDDPTLAPHTRPDG